MAQRTYLKQLFKLANRLFKYMGKYGQLAKPFMTTQQIACFDATLTAIEECVEVFTPAPPTT